MSLQAVSTEIHLHERPHLAIASTDHTQGAWILWDRPDISDVAEQAWDFANKL